mmetsp:Transcript_38970/g.87136  ORF Transcript_38970/g.87136 Transcript_38970/m.87136 type:complete len:217 (-) Transcript_38970:156-806(-)
MYAVWWSNSISTCGGKPPQASGSGSVHMTLTTWFPSRTRCCSSSRFFPEMYSCRLFRVTFWWILSRKLTVPLASLESRRVRTEKTTAMTTHTMREKKNQTKGAPTMRLLRPVAQLAPMTLHWPVRRSKKAKARRPPMDTFIISRALVPRRFASWSSHMCLVRSASCSWSRRVISSRALFVTSRKIWNSSHAPRMIFSRSRTRTRSSSLVRGMSSRV